MEQQTAQEILASAKKWSNKSDLSMIKTKATISGAFTGLVAGAMVGYYKNYNVYMTSLAGAFIGGIVTNAFLGTNQEKEDQF